MHRCALAMLMAVLTGAAVDAPARAQTGDWPNQAVRMTVPFPAGGPADILARFVGERLSKA